nr:type VI secretion system baseplate subunit TssG [candidate division Zixibacteria bacterium]
MTADKNNLMPDFCSRRSPMHYTTALNILMKMGVSLSRVEILAVGEYENYRGEVNQQEPDPGTPVDSKTRIVLKIGYPSPVDQMPYQFFYGLQRIRSDTGEWEENARRLMAPFDAATIRGEATACFEQLKYDYGTLEPEHLMRVLRLFDFDPTPGGSDLKRLLFWISMLPNFHHWAGNPDFVATVLNFLFGYRIEIIENTETEYDIPVAIQSRLGSKTGRLGRETVLGRRFRERDSSYEVVIKGVPASGVADFLPGHPVRKQVEWVLGFCMPNNLAYRIRVRVDAEPCKIGTKEARAYLGYATYV